MTSALFLLLCMNGPPPSFPEAGEAFPACRGTAPADAANIAKWVKNLGDRRWSVREEASIHLAELGEWALEAIRDGHRSEDTEVRERCLRLFDSYCENVKLPNTAYMTPLNIEYPSIYSLCGPLMRPPAEFPHGSIYGVQEWLSVGMAPVPRGLLIPFYQYMPNYAGFQWNYWNPKKNGPEYTTILAPMYEFGLVAHWYMAKALARNHATTWSRVGDVEAQATKIMVRELLWLGCNRDWVKAWLEEMNLRGSIMPFPLKQAPEWIANIAGLGAGPDDEDD